MDSFSAQDSKAAKQIELGHPLSSKLPRYLVFGIEQRIWGFGMNLKRYQTEQKIDEAHQCGVPSIIV